MPKEDMPKADKPKRRNFLARRYYKEGCYIIHCNKKNEITYIYKWCRTKLLALEWIKNQGPLATVYSIVANTRAAIAQRGLNDYIELDKDLR